MDSVQIYNFNKFCDQLNEIRVKFLKWNLCEKTVGLYYLMAGLPFSNAKFLQNSLEKSITSNLSCEHRNLERNANDSEFVSKFLLEKPHDAVSLVLTYLPLLKPGNRDTAECYLKAIENILTEYMAQSPKVHTECLEIMSYVYIHPAFTNDDKQALKGLVRYIFDKVSPENILQSEEMGDGLAIETDECEANIARMNRRSFSLTPGQLSSNTTSIFCGEDTKDISYSSENISHATSKQRSFSLSSENSLFACSSYLPTSISETRLQDLILMNNRTAMKSIIAWLKSLRLHKYSWVFNNLTFTQMLDLSEENLEAIGITKGARHKLLLNITKLKERSAMLIELEGDIIHGGDLNIALKKLKSVLQSPLQLSMGEDLQSLFVRVTGKVYTQLLMMRQPSEELILTFNSLCERAVTMEDAFDDEQKKKMNMWMNQLVKVNSFAYQDTITSNRPQMDSKYYLTKLCSISSSYTKKSSSFPNMKKNVAGLQKKHRHSVGSVALENQLHSMHRYQQTLKNGFQSQCSRTTASLDNNKFDSSDALTDTMTTKKVEQNVQSRDIENSLESLCIQMMEHALGP